MKRLVMIVLILASPALAEPPRPAIVLVHGAFADASGWSRVIPILQRDGYFVTAVQIPLTSLSGRQTSSWRRRMGPTASLACGWWCILLSARSTPMP